jgi:DNA (cytosine-5)-methyltransferase 1
MHNVLDLFSGIGGFSLGLERTGGFTTSAFCEICPEARKVLRKHWADVPIYEDITKLTARELHYDGIEIDCITGGFPCQDISLAGKGEGIVGERSGLWAEMFRLIADVRPRWVIAENVSALRSKGLTLVLQDISSIGYHAEWHCIPASAIGAPHQRDRIWIIAYPESARTWKDNGRVRAGASGASGRKNSATEEGALSDTQSYRGGGRNSEGCADGERVILSGEQEGGTLGRTATGCGALPRAECWAVESNVGRVGHGIPRRVDRLKQLGNSVVPQIPELIGNAILKKEGKHGCYTGIE